MFYAEDNKGPQKVEIIWKYLYICAFFTLLKARELVCEQDAENSISPLILYSGVYV